MPKFNDPSVELTYLEKDDVLMSGSPDDFANIKAQNLFNRSLTRAELQTLITDSELNIGQKYTITNAVGSTLSLVVCAVSTNDLDEVAVNSANGENYIYDIVTDTATQSENEIPFSINTPTNGQGLFYNSTDSQWKNRYTPFDFSGKNGINVFPHRGVTYYNAPENSLISIYHAYLTGAKMVELDVKATSDGVLVLLHDSSINSQFTNSDGSPIVGTVNIADITYAQALTYIRSSTIDGYKIQITSLDEALQECAKYNITPFLELPSGYSSSLDDNFIEVTRKYFVDQDILLQSFDDDVVVRLIGKAGYYPVFNSGNVDLASEYRGSIFVNYTDINQTLVDEAIAANTPIFAYTVTSQSELNRLIKLGVVNITSDNISPIGSNYTYIDNYNSGLNFTNATIVSGSASAGESLVTLNNAGTLQTPDITCVTYGIIDAEVVVNGTCAIALYVGGVLYDTITNSSTKTETFKINRLIDLANTFYIKVTSSQSSCKVISVNANSYTFPNAVQNRTFAKAIRSDVGIGIGFDATSGNSVLNAGATTPSIATWDSGGFGKKFAFNQATYIDNIMGVASDTAIHKSTFVAKKSRGTLAVPTTVASGDDVGTFLGAAYDGTLFRNFASIDFKVDGAVSTGTVPMALIFNTGTTSRTEKARITSSGRFLFGATTDSGSMFQIVGTTAITGNTTVTGTFGVTGNTTITGTLSSTGQNTITKSAGGIFLRADGGTTNASYNVFNNTGGNFYYGVNSSTGGGLFSSNVTAYAFGICAESARDIFFGTNNSVRVGIFSTGEVNIGSGTTRASASALFSVTSTTQGFLPPRMTTTQKNAISSPAAGLVVYDSTLAKLCVYTTTWETVTSA